MENELFKDDPKYLEGTQNWLIRAYFYCSNGLTILNEFRNLFLGIIAIYVTLKITNIYVIVGIVVGSIVVLTLMGWYKVHRMAKRIEYLTTRFGTSFGIRSFNFQEESHKLLQEILEELRKNGK